MMHFTEGTCVRVEDRNYGDVMQAAVERATWRIWVSMFIVDPRPSRDVAGMVSNLLDTLSGRRRVGVDVRVLTAGALNSADIAVANLAAGLLLTDIGVPTRRLFETGVARSSSHAKFVVVDGRAFVGSQNWTHDGFRNNTEDAVMLTGPAVEHIAGEFHRLWQFGKGMPNHAAV